MNKIILKKGILILISIVGIFACTKEITDDLIASFDITESHEIESFLNIPQLTKIDIITPYDPDVTDFQLKYEVLEGEGSYTINDEIIQEGTFISLSSLQNDIHYMGTKVGQNKVVITIKSDNLRAKTIDVNYTINDTGFVFKAETASPLVSISETLAIDMNITEVSSATYKTKYSILNADVDGAGVGSIKVGDETLSQDTFIDVTKGDFSWSFEAVSLGDVDILLTTKSSFDIEIEKTISISVTELSTYTFEVNSTVSEAITDDEVVLNFTITDNGVSSAYKMTYTTSLSGALLYDGQTYVAGDEIPIIAGAVTANYTGTEIGEHLIDFKVVNSNQVPIEKTGNVVLNYSDPSTELPVITLNGDNPTTLTIGEIYTELATANDPQDGDITADIIFEGDFDGTTNTIGTFIRIYDVVDSEGNFAIQKTRTIIIEAAADTTPPVITLLGDNPLNLTVGDTYIEPGATATDDVDGDTSANIVIDDSGVDTSTTGNYQVTYNVSDAAGNSAIEVIRTVTVVEDTTDMTAPVITLLGDNPLTLTVGDTYIEPGATATDDADGDISANIVIDDSDIDTSATGNYQVTYNVSDTAGNSAIEVIRTVNVVQDTTAPVITLLGDNPLVLNLGDAYVESGATATDDIDGDISANITINSSNVNIGLAGSYQVTYNVSDATGNAAIEVIRTVTVEPLPDTVAPVIALNGGGGTVTLTLGDVYTEAATASDNVDGTITANIVFGGNFDGTTTTEGTFTRTYNVSDAAGNAATEKTRTIIVEPLPDITPPVITLNGSATIIHTVKTQFTDPGATATDNVDGSVTVTTEGSVNINLLGTYSLTYTAKDAAGNIATKNRTVEVVDDIRPTITLTGASSVNIDAGDSFTDQGATANDNFDGNITAAIVKGGSVNTGVPGNYTLTYDVKDSSGNSAIQKKRTVVVKSVTPSYDNGSRLIRANPGLTVTYSISGSDSSGANFLAYVQFRKDALDGSTITTCTNGTITQSNPSLTNRTFTMPPSGRVYVRTSIDGPTTASAGGTLKVSSSSFTYTVTRFPGGHKPCF